MGKKKGHIFVCGLLVLLLCACGLLAFLLYANGSDLPKDGWWLEGRYLRGNQADLIVSGEWNVISMGAADETVSFEGLEDGDVIRVYIDYIQETWPGQTCVYAVEKLEDGELQVFSVELLGELEEMGWLETGSDG